MIQLSSVVKTYESKAGTIEALKGIDLKVAAGEIYGIIGHSGAGKSTLIRCINMLERPTGGTVLVDGEDMGALTEAQLRQARQKISMIFQHFNLLASRTVYANVAFPLEIQGKSPEEIRTIVLPLLELVGLGDRQDYYPSQLSGGQKQRVGIARALASQPKVLLCDEATSALDPQTTKSILALLRDINNRFNLTIVLITHEMQVIKEICDKVAVIEGGLLVEQGPVLDVFTNPQAKTTQDFISTIINRTLPPEWSETTPSPTPIKGADLLLRLSFIGQSAEEPIIAGLIRRFNVDISILYGNIDHIKDTPYGTLLVSLSGDDNNIQEALRHLQERDLGIEVIGYVARRHQAAH